MAQSTFGLTKSLKKLSAGPVLGFSPTLNIFNLAHCINSHCANECSLNHYSNFETNYITDFIAKFDLFRKKFEVFIRLGLRLRKMKDSEIKV